MESKLFYRGQGPRGKLTLLHQIVRLCRAEVKQIETLNSFEEHETPGLTIIRHFRHRRAVNRLSGSWRATDREENIE